MIESVYLRNFKCFLKQEIACRPLTLLSGLNGVGKSTCLQALLLLRQSEQALHKNEGLVLNGHYVKLGTNSDVFCQMANDETLEIGMTWQGRHAQWGFNYDKTQDILAPSGSRTEEQLLDSSVFSQQFFYLEAERIGPRTSLPMSVQNILANDLGSQGQYTAHFLGAFGERHVEKFLHHNESDSEEETSFLLKEQVSRWLGEVSPGAQLKLNESPKMDLINVEYAFPLASKVMSQPFRATNVGFGLSYTLPVLTALLASQRGQLIILENPEAHLHPRGQSRIGELIARVAASGRQVIFETHSDHVLNGIRVAVHQGVIPPEQVALHFFHRDKGITQMISPKMDRAGRMDQHPKYFFDEYDRNLDKLLDPPAGV